MMNCEGLSSKTIDFLRFPLILGVVLIHNDPSPSMLQTMGLPSGEAFPFYHSVSYFFSQVVGRISVPLFFFISGYLFFTHHDLSPQTYLKKWRKRIHTLLIPYIFWNFSIIALYFIAQSIPALQSLFPPGEKWIKDYHFSDFLSAFWDIHRNNMPVNAPFWFIRNLMVAILLSPFIALFIRYFRQYGVLLLGAAWYFNYWIDITGISSTSFFFFTAGAYFSINRLDLTATLRPTLTASVVLYPVLAILNVYYWDHQAGIYFHRLSILAGILFAINISSYYLEKNKCKVNAFLLSASFFVFAVHEPYLTCLQKIIFKILHPHQGVVFTVIYFLLPTLLVCIALGIYRLLKHYFPRFTQVITGGR